MFRDRNGVMAGLAFLLLGLLSLTILIPYGIDVPSNVRLAVLSPSYYPRLVSIATVIVGVAVTVRAATAGAAEETEPLSIIAMVKVAAVVLVLLSTALALPHVGFVLTSAVALVALMLVAGERRLLLVVGIALTLPLSLHFFFTQVANVPIPEGILRPLLGGI